MKFRRQYALFRSRLAKFRAFCKLECTLPPFLGRLGIETGAAGAFFVTGLCVIHGYHVYKVWKPGIGEAFVCFAEKGNFHDRKVITQHQTTSPSVTLLPNLRQVRISLSGTVPEVCIAIMQYQGVPPLPKLEVLPNFRVGQYINFVEAKLLQVCEL